MVNKNQSLQFRIVSSFTQTLAVEQTKDLKDMTKADKEQVLFRIETCYVLFVLSKQQILLLLSGSNCTRSSRCCGKGSDCFVITSNKEDIN